MKSQGIYCMVTSTGPNQNQEPYSRSMNKVICSLSVNTCSFLEEYTARKCSSLGPFPNLVLKRELLPCWNTDILVFVYSQIDLKTWNIKGMKWNCGVKHLLGDNKTAHFVSLWRGSVPCGNFISYSVFFTFLWPRISGWNTAPEESQFVVGRSPKSVSVGYSCEPLLKEDPSRSDTEIHSTGEMPSHCWDILIQAGEVAWMPPQLLGV